MILKNMGQEQFYQQFAKYAAKYEPFDWDTLKSDFRQEYKDKNNLITSFYRYFKVISETYKYWKKNNTVIDFGIFPGVLPKIFYDFFPKENYKYYGVGLGFTPEFIEGMKKINVELWETELDPNYFVPKKVNPVPYHDIDLVLFLDVIEHLSNPIYSLDMANKCLKKGGYMILTTDNLTSISSILTILKGNSILPHPLLTHMFYIDDWRPHFREYAKNDLVWILKHCGFSVEKHEYFNRKQGGFKIKNGYLMKDNKVKDNENIGMSRSIKRNIKNISVSGIKTIFSLFPHFCDHQLIVAKKVFDTEELAGKRPDTTNSIDEWKQMREKYLGY